MHRRIWIWIPIRWRDLLPCIPGRIWHPETRRELVKREGQRTHIQSSHSYTDEELKSFRNPIHGFPSMTISGTHMKERTSTCMSPAGRFPSTETIDHEIRTDYSSLDGVNEWTKLSKLASFVPADVHGTNAICRETSSFHPSHVIGW